MNPIVYSEGSKKIVAAYEALDEKSSDYWSNDEAKKVKKEIKDHYIKEQQYKCAYCSQLNQTENHAVWDAEHIISQNMNPKFMFEPRNLAVSCKDCNITKGEKEPRKNKNRITFPVKSSDYIIVHPHFDDYDDYIGWAYPVCFPKGPKGQKTIEMCGLLRFAAESIDVDMNIQDKRFANLIGELFTAKTRQDGEAIAAGLDVYLQKLPES